MAGPRSSLGVWILAVAVGCFAAGAVAGFALPEMFAADEGLDATERYVRDFVRKYGLSKAQERSLRMVLQEDQRVEMEILRSADWNQLPVALQSRRLEARRRTEQRIRFVLDERQRALYDRDSRPQGPAKASAATAGRKDDR